MQFREKYHPINFEKIDVSIDIINDTLTGLQKSSSHNEIHDVIDRFIDCVGIDGIRHLCIPKSAASRPFYYAHSRNMLEYSEAFSSGGLLSGNPCLSVARRTSFAVPFGFSRQRRDLTKTEKQIYSLQDSFGLGCGVVQPVHSASCFSIFTMSFQRETRDLAERLPKIVSAANIVAAQMHDALCRISCIDSAYERIDLSERQIECLTWVAAGKTAGEISSILSISATTVIFHLEGAKKRLGAFTISQAVVRAMHLGLISA